MTHTTLHLTHHSGAFARTFEITISDAVYPVAWIDYGRERPPYYGFYSWDRDIRPLDYSGIFGEEGENE